MDTVLLWVALVMLAACFGAVTGRIAGDKGHSPLAYGVLGFCFPLVGLLVALLQPDRSLAAEGRAGTWAERAPPSSQSEVD